jgi:hypothetical protein
MTGTSIDSTQKASKWYVMLCKWLWGKRGFVWSAVILNLILGVIVTLLFTSPSALPQLPIGWAFRNLSIVLLIFVVILSLTVMIGLVSRLPGGLSNKQIKRLYLKRMLLETETLKLIGIPLGLIAEGVSLVEVFIPLQLRPNRPRADYPLTASELKDYHHRLEHGQLAEDIERLLFDAEKNWLRITDESDRMSIEDLWERLMDISPAAVIQGFPGMGKTTLMARLTLHMARCGLGQADSSMPSRLEPTLLPIFVSLGAYATARIQAAEASTDLSLSAYLKGMLTQLRIVPDLPLFLQKSLEDGRCLVLLDGLDEVSDPQMRKQVQEQIKAFVLEYRSTPGNRFLITSRVAGYDQDAFPDYPHYTIAELTSEQIQEFLPRWCRAIVRRDHVSTVSSQAGREEAIVREAEQMASKLSTAVGGHQGVSELVENPLLLTLLAVMQQNSIELPRQRIDLYTAVTRMLLENRNIAKKLVPIPETQAVQRLGPIAFEMQGAGNSFARQKEVMNSLVDTIGAIDGGSTEEVREQAELFLARIRERGGLFVLRAGV